MNIKKIITAMLAAIILPAAVCAAAEIEAVIDRNTSDIVVSGELGEELGNRRLIMYCMKDGVNAEDIPEENDLQQSTELISALSYTQSDESGAYSFPAFKVNGGNGSYRFYVTAYGADKVYSFGPVFAADKASIDAFVEAVQNRTAAEIENLIKNNDVGLVIPLYDMLTAEGKSAACAELAENSFNSLTDFMEKTNRAAVKPGIKYPSDGASLDKLLYPDKYSNMELYASMIAEENGMERYKNHSAFMVLEKLDNAKRVSVLNNALSLSTDEDLEGKISISTIMYEISAVSGYGEITGIIGSHKEDALSELDFNKYNRSNYRNNLNKDLLTKQFNTCGELVKYITDYIADAGTGTGSGSGSGSGGGGGGGSKSSGASGSANITPVMIGGQSEARPKDELSQADFSDMEGYEWAKTAVAYLSGRGIVSGRDDGSFDPSGNVTREEYIKMIVTAYSLYDESARCGFEDVPADSWYAGYVASAVSKGIVKGVSDLMFGAGSNITRQDMAVIAARASDADTDGSAAASFTDFSEIAEYARGAVSWMKSKGYVNGYEDGSFGPGNFCTRAEAAKIIYEMIKE